MILRVRPFDDSHGAGQTSRRFDRKYKGSNNCRKKDATELYEYNKDWLPRWLSGEEPPAGAGDTGSIPGPGRSHRPRSNYARPPQPPSQRSGARRRSSRDHVPRLRSPHSLERMLHAIRGHGSETPRTAAPEDPRSPRPEKSPCSNKTQHCKK